MEIGIVTFHRSENYGSVLQAYALAKYLEIHGYNAEIIDYYFKHDYRKYELFGIYDYFKHPQRLVTDIMSFHIHKKRKQNFTEFRERFLPLSKEEIFNSGELKKYSEKYDCFICGSDQIWNLDCTNGINDGYFLRFVSGKRKIAYAPSSGAYQYDESDIGILKYVLDDFAAISVREKSMQQVLRQAISCKNVEVVLDPTMLLDVYHYDELSTYDDLCTNYIFIYILGGSRAYKNIIDYGNKLRQEFNWTIKYVIDTNNGKGNLQGEDCSGCSPTDFLGLIKNAKFVLTNSFHATVFSILFHKDFVSFARNNSKSRTFELLESLGLEDRFWDEHEKVLEIEGYDNVERKLRELRTQAEDFLLCAIEGE